MIHPVWNAGILILTLTAGTGYASDRLEEGREAYRAACAGCHESGAAGTPQAGNPQDWADRSNLWESVLFEHANKGYVNMPAKGGATELSDADVEAAAEYMLSIIHPDRTHD